MFVRGDISILIPELFRCVVAILTAPAVKSSLPHTYLDRQRLHSDLAGFPAPPTVLPGIEDLQTVGGRNIKTSHTFFTAISATVVLENF
jgi:hypothetical protein